MPPPNAGAPTRRTWNKEEYEQKAKDRIQQDRERAKENEERAKKGLKPRRRVELPKATQDMQAREKDLELRKNEGKTLMVDSVAGGRKGPGFYCETCNRTFKDSIAYLDHVNGRFHLRKLGQTTQVARSTLEEVQERLKHWREQLKKRHATGKTGREYDFEARLEEIAQQQRAEKEVRRAKRREERAAKKRGPPTDGPDGREAMGLDEEAMQMMGFAAFGSSKRR